MRKCNDRSQRTVLLWSILIGMITEVIGRIRRNKMCFSGHDALHWRSCFGRVNGDKNSTAARSGIRTHASNRRPEYPNKALNPFDTGLSLAPLTTRPSWQLDLLSITRFHPVSELFNQNTELFSHIPLSRDQILEVLWQMVYEGQRTVGS